MKTKAVSIRYFSHLVSEEQSANKCRISIAVQTVGQYYHSDESIKLEVQAIRKKMTDKDNVSIEVTVKEGDVEAVIDGHYNIRTNFVHLPNTPRQLRNVGIECDDLVSKIESREVELN